VLVLLIFLFIFGLIVGSFLNVVIYRLPRGLSAVWGRSFCPKCKHQIAWYDNIPLLSFTVLRGRCRHCNSPISVRYPIVELLTAVITVTILNFKFLILNQILILNFKNIVEILLSLIFAWALIVVFFIDLEHQIIPDEVLFPLIGLWGIYQIFLSGFSALIPAAGAALFLFLIWAVTRGKGMGLGDVKLAFLMGLVLGFPNILTAFYLAFLTGALIGVILVLNRKAKLGQPIPFGPFLTMAALASFLWGEQITSWFLKSLF